MCAKKCIRSQCSHSIHGLFAKRNVVAEIEADANPFAAKALQPCHLLGGAPAFVIFYAELHFVFAQNRLCQCDGFLALLKHLFEGLQAGRNLHSACLSMRHGRRLRRPP